MKKTKIICTLGPSVDSVETISELLRRGMNGARFNFSHGSHESQLATLERLETAMAQTGLRAAKIMDTKGPEIRIKSFDNPKKMVILERGAEFTLCTDEVPGDETEVTVTYPKLPQELKHGDLISLSDGLIQLEVDRIEGGRIVCIVTKGGLLSKNKSLNVPGVPIALPTLAEKDRRDLAFAAEHDFDYIAASFVRSAEDVQELRKALNDLGGQNIRIIAKIENQQGVDNMDEIIRLSDGIMVARGDLGVEIPAAKVPLVQKKLIAACRAEGKIVIVATQMLDSMIHSSAPTRAEVSDVANAVFEGASCVMLSGETANGEYPLESLDTMRTVVEEAEGAIDYWKEFKHLHIAVLTGSNPVTEAVTHSCCVTAMDLSAKAIVNVTQSGYTSLMVGRFRPGCTILALSPVEKTVRQLSLAWGVEARHCPDVRSTDALFDMSLEAAASLPDVHKGDMVVLVAGVPIGVTGSTNLVKAQQID